MKTDDLIAALAADAKSVSMPIGRTLAIAVAGGAVAAALLFLFTLGPRADVGAAVEDPRFVFKCVVTLSLLASALGLAWHLARPGDVPAAWIMALAIAPVLLALGTFVELLVVPASEWTQRLVGSNALVCMVLIPMLSALPLVAVILALRRGATSHPVLSGATAGIVSASIGATLYATHCPDDSPLFIATWYVIAVALMALVGAILGARLLRW